jgi:hypothetical protein
MLQFDVVERGDLTVTFRERGSATLRGGRCARGRGFRVVPVRVRTMPRHRTAIFVYPPDAALDASWRWTARSAACRRRILLSESLALRIGARRGDQVSSSGSRDWR